VNNIKPHKFLEDTPDNGTVTLPRNLVVYFYSLSLVFNELLLFFFILFVYYSFLSYFFCITGKLFYYYFYGGGFPVTSLF